MIDLIGPRPHETAADLEALLGNGNNEPSGHKLPNTPKHVGDSTELGDGIEAGGGIPIPLASKKSQL